MKKSGVKNKLTQEQLARIREKLTEILNYEPRIGVFGKTGAGKSSLCNALFGQDVCPIGDVEACTRNPQEVFLNMDEKGIKLVDVPGVGESQERDKEYGELYASLLPELDVVLWLLNILAPIGVKSPLKRYQPAPVEEVAPAEESQAEDAAEVIPAEEPETPEE